MTLTFGGCGHVGSVDICQAEIDRQVDAALKELESGGRCPTCRCVTVITLRDGIASIGGAKSEG